MTCQVRISALALVLLLGLPMTTPASGQVTFVEVEPNNSKLEATLAFDMVDGDRLVASTPAFSGDTDIFHVRTAPLVEAIYVHRLFFATTGEMALLGRAQSAGTIDPASSIRVQTNSQ